MLLKQFFFSAPTTARWNLAQRSIVRRQWMRSRKCTSGKPNSNLNISNILVIIFQWTTTFSALSSETAKFFKEKTTTYINFYTLISVFRHHRRSKIYVIFALSIRNCNIPSTFKSIIYVTFNEKKIGSFNPNQILPYTRQTNKHSLTIES